MAKFNSTHTGLQIDTAINTVVDTVPLSGSYIASSSNKLTPVNQVIDMIANAITGLPIIQVGDNLKISQVYSASQSLDNLILQ